MSLEQLHAEFAGLTRPHDDARIFQLCNEILARHPDDRGARVLRVAILYGRRPRPLLQCLREFRWLSQDRPAGLRASMAVASCLLQLGRLDEFSQEAARYFALCPAEPLGDRRADRAAYKGYRVDYQDSLAWLASPADYLKQWHGQIGLPGHYFKRPDAEVYLAAWLTLRAYGIRPTLRELRSRVMPPSDLVDPLRLADVLTGYGLDVTYCGEPGDWSPAERALRERLSQRVQFRPSEPVESLLQAARGDAFVWVGYGYVDYLALSPLQAELDGRLFLPFHSDVGWMERREFDRVWAGPGAYREALLCKMKES